jgi:multidrug resistance efflux pump
MTRTKRFLFILVILGTGIAGISLLAAAKLTGGNGTDSKDPTTPKTIKDSSKGVVCLGTVDNDQQVIAVYPDNFPPMNYPIRILEVKKKEGDLVKKGDEIAVLDLKIPKLLIEKAEIGVTAGKAQMSKARQALDLHKVSIDVQESIIDAKEHEISAKQQDLPRLKKGVDRNLPGAAEDYAALQEAIKALQSALESEKKKLNGLKAIQPTTQIDLARADLNRAELDLQMAQEVLSQAVYKSPVDGKIQRSSLYDGMVFGPQMRKEPLMIQPTGKLVIRAEIGQEYAHRVALNQKAIIFDYSNPNLSWKGKVSKIADEFAPKRGNSNGGIELFSSGDDPVLEVTIELEDDPKAPKIRQGQRVRINVGTD